MYRAITRPSLPAAMAVCLMVLMATSAAGQHVREISGDSSRTNWAADLEYLVGAVEAIHPHPFHRIARSDWETAHRALQARLPEMDDREAAVGLMRIAALVADGHTGLRPRGRFLTFDRWYPLRLTWLAEGTVVTATDSAHGALLGAQVETLGGFAMDEVWTLAMSVSSGENDASRLFNAALYLSVPDMLAGLGLIERSALELDLVLMDGSRASVVVEAVDWEPDFDWLLRHGGAPGAQGLRLPWDVASETDLSYRRADDYWFERDGDILYAQINQVQDSNNPVWVGTETRELTLAQFFDLLLGQVDHTPPGKLIIDLRGNLGGNNDLARSLPRGLASRPEINRSDRLFVLTGRATYSAAMNLVSMLEDQTNATFVGETPGGSPRHYGDAANFLLPESDMVLRISTVEWDTGVSPWDVREQMEPDVPAAPSFDALRRGRDPALDSVRTFRGSHELSERLLSIWTDRGQEAALAEMNGLKPPSGPVSGQQVQQLLRFAFLLFPHGSRDQILQVTRSITDLHPESHEAWFALGRVSGFLGRDADVEPAFQRAHELRPQNGLIRRLLEAARR